MTAFTTCSWTRCGIFLGFAWVLVGCVSAPQEELTARAPVDEGRSECPHALGEPDGSMIVTWGLVADDGGADILFSRWGETPVRVNPVRNSAVAGRQVGPRMARLPSGRILVSWVDRALDPAGDIVVAASDDGGRTFHPPVRVNDDRGEAGQEYQDIAVLPDGQVALAWLDERDSDAGYQNRKQIYFSTSKDGCRTFERSRALTASKDGVCTCCRPALASRRDGALHVVYRDRVGEELFLRGMSLLPGNEDFGPQVTISAGGWRYLACPTDAPSIALGPSGSIHIAWMDGTAGEPCLWRADSQDGGRTFTKPAPLVAARGTGSAPGSTAFSGTRESGLPCCRLGGPQSQPGRASLAVDPQGSFALAWESSDGNVYSTLGNDARAEAVPVESSEGSSAHSPQVVASAKGFSMIWVESRWREAPDGSPPKLEGRLRRVQLQASIRTLSTAQRK